jgi:hypothetical protein
VIAVIASTEGPYYDLVKRTNGPCGRKKEPANHLFSWIWSSVEVNLRQVALLRPTGLETA